MSLLDLPPGLYRGRVTGAESGDCEARVEVRRIPGGCLALDYEAVGAAGLQHVEHTLVTPGALHVAFSEAPGITVLSETSPGVHDAAAAGPYALRIVAGWDGATLSWAWHWAAAGSTPTPQSLAVVEAVDS